MSTNNGCNSSIKCFYIIFFVWLISLPLMVSEFLLQLMILSIIQKLPWLYLTIFVIHLLLHKLSKMV